MNEQDIRELYKDYNRLASAEAREIAEIRKSARGILKDGAIARILRKEYHETNVENIAREVVNDPVKYKAASQKQGIVLAYGMGERSYRLADLCEFVIALSKARGKFNNDVQGIPYASLLRASLPIDRQRAREVRNATYYQRRGNILFFRVTGNSRPFYRVQIRLEGWKNAILGTDPVFTAVREVLSGRISIECPCGRHQYWYRYMATIGNYGLKPAETGFPKIRNRTLTGCCCKHALKVLGELKSNRLVLLLSKELERERERPGFSDTPGTRMLSAQDLRLAEGRRLSAAAKAVFDKYEEEAKNFKAGMKPRPVRRVKADKELITILKGFMPTVRLMPDADEILNNFARTRNIPRADLDAIIKEHNL